MYQTTILLGVNHWQIDIKLPLQETETAADELANYECKDCRLVLDDGRPAIEISLCGEPRLYFDADVVISEISEDKRAVMGPPLDMSSPIDVKTAIQSLQTLATAYIITPEEYVPSGKNLQWFFEHFGVGYRLDKIAYGVTQK
ncbi:MAG: hypothetical protein CSYNP_04012 [Syntrophus sp. SKADARSKE-3]|nr:hypothetical protein [Syntrophus sp. SKADARSKE-3]